jgi:hypothetical protein
MTKTQVLETLETMPQEFSTEALIEKLLFIEKIELAQKEVQTGKKISLSIAKQRFEKSSK